MRLIAGATLLVSGALVLVAQACANPAATEPLPEAGSLEGSKGEGRRSATVEKGA